MGPTPQEIVDLTKSRILELAYELASRLSWVGLDDLTIEGGVLCALLRVYEDPAVELDFQQQQIILQGLLNRGELLN